MKKTDEIPKGQLPTIILTTLLENDKYGYEIINDVAEKTNGKIAIKQPSLYSCLRRMEEQSLISSYWRDSDIGGRRHYYRITDYGKKYVEKWQTDVFTNYSEDEKNSEKSIFEADNDNKQPVFLEQVNLFRDSNVSPAETKAIEQSSEEKQIIDNSYVQYDLFNTTNIITKPSVEVFETIKEKEIERQDKVDVQTTTDDRISKLRNTQEIEKNESINIKQEFFLLKKKQKSFTESYKDCSLDSAEENEIQVNSIYDEVKVEDEKNYSDVTPKPSEQTININLEQQNTEEEISISGINLDKEDFENINSSPTFIDLNDEAPTIYKSTTEFIETDEQKQSTEADNTKQNEDKENIDNNTKLEEFNSNKIDKIDEKQVSPKKLDDAVFITEKADPEFAPKVRKISTTRFDHFNVEKGNSIIDKYIEKVHNEQKEPQEQIVEQPQTQNYEPIEEVKSVDCVNFEQLTQFYKENGIMFSAYKKMPKSMKPSNAQFIKKNKFAMISSLTLALFTVLEALIFGLFITKSQGGCWVFYLLVPLAFAGYFAYNLVLYIKDKNRLMPKSAVQEFNIIYNCLMTLIGILVIFSINLLCGMNFENIGTFSISFVYLSISMLNLPLMSLIKFIFNKTKLFNA